MIYALHGWNGSNAEYEPILRHLEERGYKVKGFNYSEKWGTVPLIELAKKFKKFVDLTSEEKKICVIGLSQGGIIASLAIEILGLNCSKCFTICSPWHGSWLAYLLPLPAQFPGIYDLRPNSNILNKLRKRLPGSRCRYYSVWNPFDLMVFPGNSAFNDLSKNPENDNNIVYALLHPMTFWRKPTIKFIEKKILESI
ncbi:alpha/beta hydrolase [Candidatus Woesearchaeota archaeon]|nr:alpha/beta hydrolase [Candidatus Woesearchaeota archaeon]